MKLKFFCLCVLAALFVFGAAGCSSLPGNAEDASYWR